MVMDPSPHVSAKAYAGGLYYRLSAAIPLFCTLEVCAASCFMVFMSEPGLSRLTRNHAMGPYNLLNKGVFSEPALAHKPISFWDQPHPASNPHRARPHR